MSTPPHNHGARAQEPLRVLVVEDSPIVALALDETLRAFGMVPIGPFGNIAAALSAVQDEHVDAAIVDLNIRGAKAYSLFSALDRRHIPFMIASGYADWTMPEEWQDRPRLPKPFSDLQLRARLEEVLRGISTSKSNNPK